MTTPTAPPFGQMTQCNMGQSVGRGFQSTPTRTTVQPFNVGVLNDTSVTRASSTHYDLGVYMCLPSPVGMYRCTTAGTSSSSLPTFDSQIGHSTTDGGCVWLCVSPSNGNWDNTQPDSPSLTRIPAAMPVHRAGGEDHATACMNALAQKAITARYAHWTGNTSCVAIDAAGIEVIKKGGSGPAYANAQCEWQALHDLNPGVSHGVVVSLTHGEKNANSSTYLADVWNGIGSPIQTDVPAVTGQATPVYFLVNQQTSHPTVASQAGVSLDLQGGTNESALAQLQGCTTHTGIWVGTCTKYFMPFTPADSTHLTPYGEDWLGDYEAQVIWSIYVAGVIPQPLAPSSIVAAAGTNTIVLNYGGTYVSPLVWDTTRTAPHQTGSMSAWANAKGYEVTENPVAITGCVNSGGIYQIQTAGHPYATNDTIQIYNVDGCPTANCTAVVTVSGNNFTLNGVGFLGAYVAGGTAARVVPVTGAALTGPAQVTLTLGRNISTGGCVSYAFSPDSASPGGFSGSRGGLLHDSSTAVGETSGQPLYAWSWITRNAGIT